MLDLSQNYFKEVFMSEDKNLETNIESTGNTALESEPKMSKADHHKHLDEKYPTKRGFWDKVAKDGFLLLTHILCDMKCIGKENFPKNNPYVVASNHQSYPDGVLIIDYLPKGHFKWMCCLAASDLETNHGKLGRLIMRVGRGIAVDRYGNPVRGLIKAKKEIEKGNICFVFPEGTRSHTGKLAEMKEREEMEKMAALKGELSKGTIAIVREEAKKYKVAFAPVPIANAAKYTRSVPKEYIAKNGHDVTEKFLAYARPIVGALPHSELL